MLHTSIQTSGLLTAKSFDEYDDKFKLLKECGFDAIDYNLNLHYSSNDIRTNKRSPFFDLELNDICNLLQPFKASAEACGLYFGQLHAPYPSQIYGNQGFINGYLKEAMIKSIGICEYLQSKYLVIHPVNAAYVTEGATEFKLNMEFFKELIPYAKNAGVTLCLENMFYNMKGHLCESCCSDASEALYYIDSLNDMAGEEIFGFCFDLGHANVLGKNIRKSLNTLGGRIKCLHIHDNDASQDLHMMPYSFSTNWGLDTYTHWDGFISGLADIDYKGTLDFEVHQAFHTFPKAVHKELLSLINAIGRNFSNEIEAKKLLPSE